MVNEITLLICGTQVGNTGSDDLLVVGNTPLNKIDIVYPKQYNATDYCINIEHTREYIKYILLCNTSIIRSIGASSGAGELRSGRLSFSVTIRRGFRIAGEKSPFDLLLLVKEKFMADNMFCSDGIYTFKPGDYDSVPLKGLISSFAVEQSKRYIEMTGDKDAFMSLPSEDAIRAFLSDTQYNEMSSYKSVWVGLCGDIEQPLQLEVPRPKRYSVRINDNKQVFYAENGNVRVNAKSPKETYEDYSFAVSVADLLKAPNPMFEVDEQLEEIRCHIKFKPKQFKRFVDFQFSEDLSAEQRQAARSSFKLVSGAYDAKGLQIDSQGAPCIQFVGDELKMDWVPAQSKHFDYEFSYVFSLLPEAKVNVFVSLKKAADFPKVPVVDKSVSSKTFTITGVKKKIRAELQLDGGVEETLTLAKDLKPDSRHEGSFKIELPSNRVVLSVVFKANGYKDKTVRLNSNASSIVMPDLKPITLTDKIFNFVICHHVIQMLIVFIIGFVLGVLAPDIYKSLVKSQSQPHPQAETPTPVGSTPSGEGDMPVADGNTVSAENPDNDLEERERRDFENKINPYIIQCENASLPFKSIEKMKNLAEGVKKKYKDIAQKPEGYQKLLDYSKYYSEAYAIVQGLMSGSSGLDNLEDYQNRCKEINSEPFKEYKSQLMSFRKGLQSIYYKFEGEEELSEKYYEFLLFEGEESKNFLSKAKSFKDLENLRTTWMTGGAYAKYRQ